MYSPNVLFQQPVNRRKGIKSLSHNTSNHETTQRRLAEIPAQFPQQRENIMNISIFCINITPEYSVKATTNAPLADWDLPREIKADFVLCRFGYVNNLRPFLRQHSTIEGSTKRICELRVKNLRCREFSQRKIQYRFLIHCVSFYNDFIISWISELFVLNQYAESQFILSSIGK